MADGYNIKIGLDSRAAERGVKSFTSALTSSFKALREFDKKATDAFKALDQFSKLNTSNIGKSMKGVGSAVNELNKVKINKQLVNNLQTLSRALNGVRFTGGDSLKKLPEALKGLNNIKVSSSVITALTELKAATKGFTGPPKGLSEWPKIIAKFSTSKIAASLPSNLASLKTAMRGFPGPSKSAMALPSFLKSLSAHKVSPTMAANLAALKASVSGFTGPSAKAGANLASLLAAMKGANVAHINQIAAALQRLNGIRINIGGGRSGGGNNLPGIQRNVQSLTNSMRGLGSQTALVTHAIGAFQAALGGLSLTAFIKSIYETGNSYQSLERTLGAVASSQAEVNDHMSFINDLTQQMPISIDAAATSYKKFAVAARLSGMSVEDTQGIFGDFATGFSAMGLSIDSQKYAFIALEQMISKGAIQMEELKTQLGDHLPGAVQILADSLDVPVAKLFKMIEAGEVTSDALIKMGKRVREQFAGAAEAARQSSQGQFIELGNQWTLFMKTIFNNDFNSALGALAGQLADIFKSADMQKFAADIGNAFGRLFKAIAAVANVLAQNRETVVTFMKAFVGYSAIVAVAGALRLLIAPALMLSPIFSTLSLAVGGLAKAFMFMASGKALSAIKDFFNFFSKRIVLAIAGIAALGGALYWLTQRLDEMTGTDLASGMEGFGSTALDTAKKVVGGLAGIGDTLFSEISAGVDAGASDFDKRMQDIEGANLTLEDVMQKNHEREMKRASEKAKALTNEQTELWKKINPIGAANEEYEKQIKLLDEIAVKRGLTDAQKGDFRKIIDAQTLDDRDPMGSQIKTMREELANIKAKTAEQRAFNDAKKLEQDMLKKGVAMSAEQVKAAEDYYKAIAKMNGELGSGFERYAASIGDFNDNMQEAIKDGLGSLSSEIAAFVTGADADFGKLAQSILASFAKIALDSMFKDALGAMGMDGEKNGASAADKALEKLGSLGESITTTMTNVYTSDISVNGVPLSDILSDTPLRGPLDANGKNPIQDIANTPLRGAQPLATKNGFDGTNVNPSIDRDPTFTPDALDYKFKLQQEEAARIAGQEAADRTITTGSLSPNAMGGPLAGALTPPSNVGISLNEKEIIDLKKTLSTEWVKSAGDMQGKGIIDTILNRKASGKWGNSITDVVNAKSQFSDINGRPAWQHGRNSVDDLPMSRIDARSDKLVDDWLAQRAAGAKSSVGDNLNYANPHFSDAKNRPWIDALDGPVYGKGNAIHKHGTTPELDRYRPGEFGVNLPGSQMTGAQPTVDPTITGSIAKANAELTKTSTTMQQLGTTVQQTGTVAQASAQQTQMASQQKQMATQTEVMGAQQASMGIQQAGISAQQAGPQFTQAGVQIGQAGAAAQSAGTQAATTTPGLGQFGSGIQSLLGPLSSAIPGLGQFGGAIMSLLGSLGGGGGGMGIFKEGGLSTQPVQTMNIPHFAEGTANTSGGIPSVLHPNEAVIPLTRGRKVPVEMGDESGSSRQDNVDNSSTTGMRDRPTINVNINAPDPNAFRKSKRQVQMDLASSYQRAMQKA